MTDKQDELSPLDAEQLAELDAFIAQQPTTKTKVVIDEDIVMYTDPFEAAVDLMGDALTDDEREAFGR